ncbi:serine protease [Actinocorallia longicatena]|uniref:Serine protease n=1 Tax=Actinocorallia longicatena TaxID=111803 RepID=A0ABP6QKE5_9ACTN
MRPTPHKILSSAAGAVLLGAAVLAPSPAQAIIGGHAVSAKSYPWMAALTSPVVFVRPSGHFCGGVLIKADKVLTAAHCAKQVRFLIGSLRVTFGRSDLGRKKGGTTVKVKKIWINPAFREGDLNGLETERNDVAVLTLAKKVKIKPVKLGSVTGKSGYVLGWGETKRLRVGDVRLRKATVPLVSQGDCARAYGRALEPNMTCAGSPKADTCRFDSGGPLVVQVKKKVRIQGQLEDRWEPRVVGLTSWAKGCAQPGYPGVYARVSSFLDLIKKQL